MAVIDVELLTTTEVHGVPPIVTEAGLVKFEPLIVTGVPAGPTLGLMELVFGNRAVVMEAVADKPPLSLLFPRNTALLLIAVTR